MLCPNHSYRCSLCNNLLNPAIRDYLVEDLFVIYDLKQSIVMRLESLFVIVRVKMSFTSAFN